MDIPIDFLIRAGQADTTASLREHAAKRLTFALRRFSQRIRRVTVRLVDENGPRRGVDARCSMTAELSDGRHLFVDAISAWPTAAITEASGRLSEAVRRTLGRRTHRGTPAAGGSDDGGYGA